VAGSEDPFRRQFEDLFRRVWDDAVRRRSDAFRRQSEDAGRAQSEDASTGQSEEFLRRHPMRDATVVIEERSSTTTIRVDTFVSGDVVAMGSLLVEGDIGGNVVIQPH
jgi:hypothetical protein